METKKTGNTEKKPDTFKKLWGYLSNRKIPSIDNVQHGFETTIFHSASLLSISVRPVRFNPVPCRMKN